MPDKQEIPIEDIYSYNVAFDFDFECSLRSLNAIFRTEDEHTIEALIRDSIVCYIRPFTKNYARKGRKLAPLAKVHVPSDARSLHEELSRMRMKVVAHSDMTFRNPRITSGLGVSSTQGVSVEYSEINYVHWLGRISEIKKLVEDVRESLRAENIEVMKKCQSGGNQVY